MDKAKSLVLKITSNPPGLANMTIIVEPGKKFSLEIEAGDHVNIPEEWTKGDTYIVTSSGLVKLARE